MDREELERLCPEHAKLLNTPTAAREMLGEFIEWLFLNNYHIAEWSSVAGTSRESKLVPVDKPVKQWMADFLDLDMVQIEAERQMMVERTLAQITTTGEPKP